MTGSTSLRNIVQLSRNWTRLLMQLCSCISIGIIFLFPPSDGEKETLRVEDVAVPFQSIKLLSKLEGNRWIRVLLYFYFSMLERVSKNIYIYISRLRSFLNFKRIFRILSKKDFQEENNFSPSTQLEDSSRILSSY